jgi:hypothetical protein
VTPDPDFDIYLTEFELRIADEVGAARYENACRLRRDAGRGPSANWNGPDNHLRGARCEYACSLVLNLSWRPHIGKVSKDIRDVGGLLDTRSTVRRHGRLIIKPADLDHVPFVLVIAEVPRFTLAGWTFAGEGKALRPLSTGYGDPAHFIDQELLHPMPWLKEWIEKARAA